MSCGKLDDLVVVLPEAAVLHVQMGQSAGRASPTDAAEAIGPLTRPLRATLSREGRRVISPSPRRPITGSFFRRPAGQKLNRGFRIGARAIWNW